MQKRDRPLHRPLRRRVVLASLCVVLGAVLVAVWGYRHFTNLEDPPRGELIAERPSPDGSRLLRLSKIDDGGVVGDVFYRADVTEGAAAGSARLIYYDAPENFDASSYAWVDARTVRIDGRLIDVITGRYDFRYASPRSLQAGVVALLTLVVLIVGLVLVRLLFGRLREPQKLGQSA